LPARRSSVSDLPQGAFVYPPDLKPSKTPLLIGLLLAAAAIGAVLYFVVLKRDETPAATPPPSETVATAPPTTPPSETTQPAPAPVEVDAGIDEAAIDIEPEPDAAVTPTTTTAPSRPTRTRPTRATTTRPPDRTESEEPKSADPEEPKQAEAPPPRTNDDPGCDEVGCILEKYARPCCAKYKPADTGFQARSSESLTKPQIKAGVDRVRPRVIDCGQKHPAKGTVKVGVSVNGAGEVEGVSVKEAPDGALGECVADAMRRAQFAKTANGGSFTYPFVF
jgi:TonB family protein